MAKRSVVKREHHFREAKIRTIPIEIVVGSEFFTIAVKTTLNEHRTAEQLVAGYLNGITNGTVVDTEFLGMKKHEKRMIEIV